MEARTEARKVRLAWEAVRRVPAVGDPSPWGEITHVTEHAPGVAFVSTASHGGFFVDAREERIPLNLRLWGEEWSHGWGCEWFEEDCCAHAVVFHYAREIAATVDADSGELRTNARENLKALGKAS